MSTTAEKLEGREVSFLKEILRKAANERMSLIIEPETCVATECTSSVNSTDDDWKVKIKVEIPEAIFVLSIYYKVNDAKAFAMCKPSFKNRVLSPFLCHDFIREYSNLTAGSLKAWFEKSYQTQVDSKKLVVNLPNQKPASSEPFSTSEDTETELWDKWQICLKDSKLTCSWHVTVLNWNKLSNVMKTAGEFKTQSDGGFDFL